MTAAMRPAADRLADLVEAEEAIIHTAKPCKGEPKPGDCELCRAVAAYRRATKRKEERHG